MRVIARKTLREFWEKHRETRSALESWYKEARSAEWRTPNDVKRKFPKARFLEGNRIIFEINGNSIRLIIRVNYEFQVIYIRFIGTHAEYDKIDAGKV